MPEKRKKKTKKEEEDDLDQELLELTEAKPAKKQKSSKKEKKDKGSDDESKKKKHESDEEDPYDENLLGDEKDRNYLFSLSEVQREKIIAERYNRRKELQERKKLKKQKEKETEKEEEQASGSRLSKNTKRASALSDLRKKRLANMKSRESSSSESSSSSEGEKEGSDEEFVITEKTPETTSKKPEPPKEPEKPTKSVEVDSNQSTCSDIQKICLRRAFIEQHYLEPLFEETVKGLFVRLNIGQHDGKPVYRLCRIEEITTNQNKSYSFANKKINKYLLVSHGTSKKTFPMDLVSNHSVQESEFAKWVVEMESHNLKVLTKQESEDKRKKLLEIDNFVRTDEYINKHRSSNKGQDRTSLINKKSFLFTRKKSLVSSNLTNTEEFRQVCEELDEIEKILTQYETPKFDKTSQINLKHKQENQTMSFDPENQDETSDSVFSRRLTMPSNIVYTESIAKETLPEEPTKKEEKKEEKETLTNSQTPNEEVQMKEAHNFDLDISAPPPRTPKAEEKILPVLSLDVQKEETKQNRTISVNDYKRRRGML